MTCVTAHRAMPGARSFFPLLLLLVALLAAGCREQGDVTIHALDFQGVKQVDKKALAAALQTKKGSRLPCSPIGEAST